MTCSLPISVLKRCLYHGSSWRFSVGMQRGFRWLDNFSLALWDQWSFVLPCGQSLQTFEEMLSCYLYYFLSEEDHWRRTQTLTSPTLPRGGARGCSRGKYGFLSYRCFSKGRGGRGETKTSACFLLKWAIISLTWGWKFVWKFLLPASSEINKITVMISFLFKMFE